MMPVFRRGKTVVILNYCYSGERDQVRLSFLSTLVNYLDL